MKSTANRLESGRDAPDSSSFRLPPSALSVIVPVLNEANTIDACLRALVPLRARGVEVIVADGGSTDRTPSLAAPLCDRIVSGARGRALQMNAGAAQARGDVLLFLHADVLLPADADRLILASMRETRRRWGRFDVRLSGSHPLLRAVAFLMNLRSRLTGIATGDQCLFVERALFDRLGGFARIPLMEDIELSARLKRCSRPACLRERVVASSRRWEAQGMLGTILMMWRLRLAFYFGASPDRLARIYYRNES
ncbi:MAG: TIGR04283 family arsenosugar biosynthesis glycosyltransferase [Burkholderiales bacterium]